MAVPLSTYLMALILAIGTCFCGKTKKGCQAATPGIPSPEPQGTEDETLQPRIKIGFASRLASALMLSTCDNFASDQVLRRGVFVSPMPATPAILTYSLNGICRDRDPLSGPKFS